MLVGTKLSENDQGGPAGLWAASAEGFPAKREVIAALCSVPGMLPSVLGKTDVDRLESRATKMNQELPYEQS